MAPATKIAPKQIAPKTASKPKVKDTDDEEKGRPEFDPKTALGPDGKSCFDLDFGLFTAVPENWFSGKYSALKKDQFAQEYIYLHWKSRFTRMKADRLAKVADRLHRDAINLEKFGDDETRKRVSKLQKAKDAYRELFASLSKDVGEDALKDLMGGDEEVDADTDA